MRLDETVYSFIEFHHLQQNKYFKTKTALTMIRQQFRKTLFFFVWLSKRNLEKSWWIWMRIHLQKIFLPILPVSGTKMAAIEGCCNNKRQQKYGRRNAWICHIFNYTASKEAWLGVDGIVEGFCKIINPKYSKHYHFHFSTLNWLKSNDWNIF